MIINCEECGTRYRLDESKIKGKSVKAKCKECGHVMQVSKPEEAESRSESTTRSTETAASGSGVSASPTGQAETTSSETSATRGAGAAGSGEASGTAATRARARGLGIRGKMFLLFILVPIVLLAGGNYFYLYQLDRLQSMATGEALEVVQDTVMNQIAQKSRDVARQIDVYLQENPEVAPDEFAMDHTLRQLAIQKMGEAGYTFLYGQSEESDSYQVLVHLERELIGSPITDFTERSPEFVEIMENTDIGEEGGGYYQRYEEGEAVDKYMYVAPVGQTDYFLATTSEIEPMITPAKVIETRVLAFYEDTRDLILIGLAVVIILIFIVVFWFANRISKRITSLSDVSERISVGDLDAEIQIKGKDEIGMLAESIARMQQSVRLSIERLRRRR